MKEFIRFFRHPAATTFSHASITHKILVFLLLFISISFMRALILFAITKLKIPEEILENYTLKYNEALHFFGPVLLPVALCLIAPLVEEMVFRLGLSFCKWHIAIAFSALVLEIIGIFKIFSSIVFGATALLSVGLIFLIIWKTHQTFWDKLKRTGGSFIIYLSAILFALFHLANYTPLSWNFILFYFIILTPMFVSALIMSLLRLRFGFVYACGFHILSNVIPYTLIHYKAIFLSILG